MGSVDMADSILRNKLFEHAGRWLQSFVDRGRRSDGLLQSAQTWEAQYAAGKWDYLAELSELARFSVLAGYICHLKPGAAVLDTGCGQGTLLHRLPRDAYSRYVGIDLSPSAISVASQQQNERSTFLTADCEKHTTEERFDVIVFNEVLCCLQDPLQTVERYVRFLNPGGLVLVSLCSAARGSSTLLRQLGQAYAIVDQVCLTHSARKVTWVCTAFTAQRA